MPFCFSVSPLAVVCPLKKYYPDSYSFTAEDRQRFVPRFICSASSSRIAHEDITGEITLLSRDDDNDTTCLRVAVAWTVQKIHALERSQLCSERDADKAVDSHSRPRNSAILRPGPSNTRARLCVNL